MVSGLTFNSLIHFESIFVLGIRKWSSLILLHVAVQFSQHHLLKRLSFPTVYSCLPYCRIIKHIRVSLFLRSLSVPLIYISVFVPVPYCFDYCSFVI